MDQGNHEAASVARQAGAEVLTDITGFGLAGHLAAWCRRHQRQAILGLDEIPALPGVLDLMARDMRSTAHGANRSVLDDLSVGEEVYTHPAFELLFDPQTAGGLLLACPVATTPELLERLATLDPEVAVIGQLGGISHPARYVRVQRSVSS